MIGLERNLSRWQAAGLIDAATADSIREHERQNGRPVVMWAVAGIALMALALGLALIVAANWDRIPGHVKLGVHFAAALAAALALVDGLRRPRALQAEGALFLLVAFVLAGIALQGQVYQLASPIWQPLALWAILCGPVLVLAGTTYLTGTALGIMLGALALALAAHGFERYGDVDTLLVGAAGSIPLLLLALSGWTARGSSFAAALRLISLAYLLAVASIAHLVWATTVTPEDARDALEALSLPAVSVLICLLALRQETAAQRRVLTVIVGAAFAATAIAILTPHGEGWSWRLAGAILFGFMWASIAWAAAANGWRFLFGLGVTAIAVRLFIVYFEVFGSLASTGIGLIAGGLLVLALLAIWRRAMAWLPRRGIQP